MLFHNPMLSLFLICIACQGEVTDRASLPLCGPCLESLVTAPDLCPNCAGLTCEKDKCLRPWISHPAIDAFHARYLCIEPGYRVLKRWKVTQGRALDKQILKPDSRIGPLVRGVDLITWIPQARARSWMLGACPAEKIARWSASLGQAHASTSADADAGKTHPHLAHFKNSPPARSLLMPARDPKQNRRQAELKMHERMANRIRFEWDEYADPVAGKSILLVDDFMTTGRTLGSSAQLLRSRGALSVQTFCLGVRPLRESHRELAHRQLQSTGDLNQRARGSTAVGQELNPLRR